MAGFKKVAIPQNDGSAKRQPRFRAISTDEVIDGESIGLLGCNRPQGLQHGGFGMVEVRKA
jgi:hypothetical protein